VRVEVQRSGGFAGLSRVTAVDTANLPPADARDIEERVRTIDFDAAGRQTAAAEPRPDAFQYDVTIADGDSHRKVTLRDPTPPGFQDLYRRMLELQRRA
jgi:emfourin